MGGRLARGVGQEGAGASWGCRGTCTCRRASRTASTSPASSVTTAYSSIYKRGPSDSSESDDQKDASAKIHSSVGASKKKKHGQFESKNQFIRRRPVSEVPMSLQKQLHGKKGGGEGVVAPGANPIHSKQTAKAAATVQFLTGCLRI